MARHKGNGSNRTERKRQRDKARKLTRQANNYPELIPQDTPDEMIQRYHPKHETRKPVSAKTEAQGQLISQIKSKDIVFIKGPAGTGKTYVTAALAAEMLENKEVEKIIITRPMVACGEDMGFLPGELDEKYAPWVAPIMDVLEERLGESKVKYLLKAKRIVLSPMQFMRGASLKNAFIICDEAQNVSPSQMKMFLTRIGEGSTMVIDGDIEQSDLQDYRGVSQISGLADAMNRLSKIPEIGIVEFSEEDIVRHGITRKILKAYR